MLLHHIGSNPILIMRILHAGLPCSRQLGILRKRPRLVPLGILEVLDVYTDLLFPFLAVTCEPGVPMLSAITQDIKRVGWGFI